MTGWVRFQNNYGNTIHTEAVEYNSASGEIYVLINVARQFTQIMVLDPTNFAVRLSFRHNAEVNNNPNSWLTLIDNDKVLIITNGKNYNPREIWLIQTDSDLCMKTNSEVTLTGGQTAYDNTVASQIYWATYTAAITPTVPAITDTNLADTTAALTASILTNSYQTLTAFMANPFNIVNPTVTLYFVAPYYEASVLLSPQVMNGETESYTVTSLSGQAAGAVTLASATAVSNTVRIDPNVFVMGSGELTTVVMSIDCQLLSGGDTFPMTVTVNVVPQCSDNCEKCEWNGSAAECTKCPDWYF